MRVGRRASGTVEQLPGRAWISLLDDLAGQPGLRVGVASYGAGAAAPSSIHAEEHEILVPVSGGATLVGAVGEEALAPGDVAFVPAGEEHAIRADAAAGLEVVAIFVSTAVR